MKTVIITGASSGLGVEFFNYACNMNEIEEIWIIARRQDRLEQLAATTHKSVKVIPLDLTDKSSFDTYNDLLLKHNPQVICFVNNAGFGTIGPFINTDVDSQTAMCELNVSALTAMANLTLQYMDKGSYMINTSSIASFAPNPNMAVYCSTKAYVRSFSRCLRYELKNRKINVLALCPGPMDTEFLPVAGIKEGVSRTFDTLPRVKVKKAAVGAMKAAKKGKAIYTPKVFYKFYHLLSKILPTSLIIHFSKT